MFTIIAGALLAIIAAGLLATIIVRLRTTIGRYIIDKVRTWRKRIAAMILQKTLDDINRKVSKDKRSTIQHQLSPRDVAIWESDIKGNVIEESIEIIKEDQVDNKARQILNDHDGLIFIDPLTV